MIPEAPWSKPELVSVAAVGSRNPALAVVADTPHLVWADSKTLYHSYMVSGKWSERERISAGTEPSLAVAPNGRLHCLYTNEFANNSEIYHMQWDGSSWSLPINVSHTSGVSTRPAVAIGSDGVPHAVWSDTTPGYSVIYHGQRADSYWTSEPVSSGRGSGAILAITPEGEVYVAWQDYLTETNRYEVFASVLANDSWSVPENVSDSSAVHSLQPDLTSTPRGGCHLVWQEEKDGIYHICYSLRLSGGWTVPEVISSTSQDCRVPRIVANPQGFLQVAWLEGQILKHRARPSEANASWRTEESIAADWIASDELAVGMGDTGTLHVAASVANVVTNKGLYYGSRDALFQHHMVLPLVMQRR